MSPNLQLRTVVLNCAVRLIDYVDFQLRNKKYPHAGKCSSLMKQSNSL